MSALAQERLLTFEIGTRLFAVPITSVVEVAQMGQLACIPTLSPDVAGVINYRGDALPVVRRERLLQIGDDALDDPEHVLVISDRPTHAPRLGLNVDRVLGLIDAEEAQARGGDPVAEKRPIDGRVAHILDPTRLVARAREVIESSLGRGE